MTTVGTRVLLYARDYTWLLCEFTIIKRWSEINNSDIVFIMMMIPVLSLLLLYIDNTDIVDKIHCWYYYYIRAQLY